MEKLELIENKISGLIFMNQQWFGHFRDVLDDNLLLSDSLLELINHAKQENRKTLIDIKELLKTI